MVTLADAIVAPSSTATRLTFAGSIDEIRSEWAELATRMGSVFATPEWASTWMDVYGRDMPLRLVAGRDDHGRLRILLPMVLSRRGPIRMARFVGHGVADIQGPIAAPADASLLRPAMERALEEAFPDLDVFLGERMPVAGGWAEFPGASILRQESNPILHLATWADWEAYLATRSKKLRREFRHDERALADRHHVVVRRTTDPRALGADLDALFALHAARFGDRSSFAPREAFYRRFAAAALDRGWLRLWIMEADGRPVAARYDFSYGGVYHAYNGGRDPAFAKLSVGLILRAHTLRAAFDEGVSAYRFLRGDESYKARFGTEDDEVVTVARGTTWLGHQSVSLATGLGGHPRLRRVVRLAF